MPVRETMHYIGIDPGSSGAIVALGEQGAVIGLFKLADATDYEILEALKRMSPKGLDVIGMIERVHTMPGQGVVSAGKFMGSYYALKMALAATRIPYDNPTPQTWQRAMSCLSGGDKNITKDRAQALFPSVKVTHAIADALLIAEYCRRTHGVQQHGKEEGPQDAGH